jgi:hypothetical protein
MMQKINLLKLISHEIHKLVHTKYFLIKKNVKIMIEQAQLKIILTQDFKTRIFSIIFQEKEEIHKIWEVFKTFFKIFLEVLVVIKVIEAKTIF